MSKRKKRRAKRRAPSAAAPKRRRAKRRSGIVLAKSGKRRARSRSGSKSFTMDTAGKLAVSSMALRLTQGAAFYFARKQGMTSPKVRIIVPAALWFASAKGYIPHMDGLTAMAADQTVNAVIDTTPTIKDLFDLRFLDKPKAVAGFGQMTPRSFIETSRQIAEPMPLSGYERAGYNRAGYERGR